MCMVSILHTQSLSPSVSLPLCALHIEHVHTAIYIEKIICGLICVLACWCETWSYDGLKHGVRPLGQHRQSSCAHWDIQSYADITQTINRWWLTLIYYKYVILPSVLTLFRNNTSNLWGKLCAGLMLLWEQMYPTRKNKCVKWIDLQWSQQT